MHHARLRGHATPGENQNLELKFHFATPLFLDEIRDYSQFKIKSILKWQVSILENSKIAYEPLYPLSYLHNYQVGISVTESKR